MEPQKKTSFTILLLLVSCLSFAQTETFWWNDVPKDWNGSWPEELRTASEKSGFTYTADYKDVLEYFAMIVRKSENVHIFNMFISDQRRPSPTLVMSNPRITSPEEAKASGKTVVYLQGGIHPDEYEGKEALFMVIRDILFGDKKYLLDELVILVNPNFNIDGNETRIINSSYPSITGIRHNAKGYDVNRDAIKLETLNMQGAYLQVFNTWDPTLIFDTHRMGNTRHGYAITHAGSNVATAHKGPRDFVTYKLFPEVVKEARKTHKIEIGMHCGLNDVWPPTEFTHDNAIWSTEAKFMASGYGLRNRMSVLVENPGGESFEKAIFSHYAYTHALLKFTHKNGKEMQKICKQADDEVVNAIKTKAASGTLKNFVSGKYVSEGKISVYAYKDRIKKPIPGTSLEMVDRPNPPELIPNVDLITKPQGVKEATVPRAYLIPEDLKIVIEKLKIHGVTISQLDSPITVDGEEFIINKFGHEPMSSYQMTTLSGNFVKTSNKTFPAGTYYIDMAQPLANVIFYALEPEVRDGLLGWNLLDEYLINLGVRDRSIVYPVFKYFKHSEKK